MRPEPSPSLAPHPFYAALSQLMSEPLEPALKGVLRLIASLPDIGAAALFLIAEDKVIGELWHPSDAATQERLGLAFRNAAGDVVGQASRAAQNEVPAAMALSQREGDLAAPLTPDPIRAFAITDGHTLQGALCISPESGDSDSVKTSEAWIVLAVQLLALKLDAYEKGTKLESQRLQYERWFRTLDQQLRLLDRERQKFVALVNQSDTYVYVTDASSVIRWTNKAMTSLTGGELGADWTGLSCRDVCTGFGDRSEQGCARCPVARALDLNEPAHEEMGRLRGGTMRTLYLTALPIRSPDGLPNEVMVVLQDLTDLQVLRRSESRYRLLFERSGNAMVMVDPSTQLIVLANPMTCEILGHSEEQLLRLSLRDLHPDQEWHRIQERYSSAYAEDRPESFECRLRARDGSERVAIMCTTRFDFKGQEVMLVEFQDMTDRKRAEEALHDSEERLRHSQKMQAVGRLAGGVSHDFNNLLAVILGRIELMLDRLPADHPMRREAEQIRNAGLRGAWLTRQLLALSRREMAAPQVVNVKAIVSHMEIMLRRLIGEEIDLVTVFDTEPARVRLDRGSMEQLLLHLVVNARDAMVHGGLITVEVANALIDKATAQARPGAAPGLHVMLAVTDNGCGMDPKTRSHLFEPFFTTKSEGRGSGLGLSVVYGIVVQSGGHIEVQSELGLGTTVKLYIPSAEDSEMEGGEENADREAPGGTETVLLVEDDEAVRSVLREALESYGYTVLEASSGPLALAIAQAHAGSIQLLLTDVVMPQMRGGELAQRLASRRSELRVLFMSGYTDDAIVRRGVLDAGLPFLQKPFPLEDLATKVREALDAPPAAEILRRGRSSTLPSTPERAA